MTDLFTLPPATKVGESNGRFLGYLARGETADQLRARHKSGELPDLNTAYAREWIKEAGL